MARVTLEVPDGALAALRKDPDTFGRELRLVAAIKWYEVGEVSQGRAAEIAGVSREDFIIALGTYGVTPFQSSIEELVDEACG